jgi:hypothetical protein
VKLKALALVMLVLCASLAVCSAVVLALSEIGAPMNHVANSFVLVDGRNGTIVTPMGPIDTPGGPT